MEELRKYIQKISPETTALELDYITAKFTIKTFQKGKFLIKNLQTCVDLAIVKKGCFRIYYSENNKEINAWFAFELMPVTEMQSFISQKPTKYNIQALENCEIYSINYHDLQQLYRQFNTFQNFGLRLTEQILEKTIQRLTEFQFETAEQRYEKLLQNQNYLQRIPLKELASFLGITPNSLSRLRKIHIKK
jgi:CRP/FNR family transcriptional regulator, anaerobic regulatory protein